MSITNKNSKQLIDEALEKQYQQKTKEYETAKLKEQNKKIDKFRRLYLGPLYAECRSNPEGVRKDKLEEQYNKLIKEGCISNCSFNEFIKTCNLKTYYADCSKDTNCIKKFMDKTTEKGKIMYDVREHKKSSMIDLENNIEKLKYIIEEQNNVIRDLKNDLKNHTEESLKINKLNYDLWNKLVYSKDRIIYQSQYNTSEERAGQFTNIKKKLQDIIFKDDIKNIIDKAKNNRLNFNFFLKEKGLVGLYTGDSLDERGWNDLSGNQNHAENKGSYTIEVQAGINSIKVIKGSRNEGIIFPPSILPEEYTLITVARYTGFPQRIFDGLYKNWLSGFWGDGINFYHEGWVTPMNQNGKQGNDWTITIDTGDRVFVNGKKLSAVSNLTTNDQLTINKGKYISESSDFEVAIVAVFDRRIIDKEAIIFSDYLKELYTFL